MKYLKIIWNWIKRVFIGALIEELEKYKEELDAYKNSESELLQQIEHKGRENSILQGNIVKAANKYIVDTNKLKAKKRSLELEISLLKGEIDLKKRVTLNE